MKWKILHVSVFVCSFIALATTQSQNNSRTINPGPISRSRQSLSVPRQRGGGDGQQRGLVQLRHRLPQGRPVLNLQNLSRMPGRIPRARSFQASLPSLAQSRIDPRTGARIGARPAGNQRMSQVVAGPRTLPRSRNQNALAFVCASPRSVRCFSWPRNRDPRDAYVCDGRCRGRFCPIPCECSCVDPRLLGRLRASGRISGPELTLIDTRLNNGLRRRRLRNRILAIRLSRQRDAQAQRGANGSRGVQTSERQPDTNATAGLNFGISDDVLATLIAQPVLNEIVGPQGINQILAGEPPPLLSFESRRRGSTASSVPTGPVRQPDIRAVETSSTRAQQRAQRPAQNQNMGIPVPLSRLNFALGPEVNPSLGNMRVVMSDIRPLQDATTGLNIDLPNPTPVNPSARENTVSVRQLPGTNVLFVDLTRSPNIQGSNTSPPRMLPQMGTLNERPRPMSSFLNNRTVADGRSSSANNVLVSSSNQTSPRSSRTEFGGNLQTFLETTDPRVRPPTTDECLAQRLELWCDPQQPWEGTPGLSRWCLLNCRADNCDNQRCACACIEEILFKTKFEQLTARAP